MLTPIVGYIVVAAIRIPREQKAKIAAVLEQQEKKPLGRLVRIIQLVALLLLVAAALRWLYSLVT